MHALFIGLSADHASASGLSVFQGAYHIPSVRRPAVSADRACFGAVFPFERMFQLSLFAADAAFFFTEPFDRFKPVWKGALFTANNAGLFAASSDRLKPMVFSRLPAAGALLPATARWYGLPVVLLCFSQLTAYRTDFFALPGLRFPYENMAFITRCSAADTGAPVPVVLRRPGLPADLTDAFAEIPVMAFISRFSALCAFAAVPPVSQ